MNQNAEDLLMGAPSDPTAKQLKDLNIKILDKKKWYLFFALQINSYIAEIN